MRLVYKRARGGRKVGYHRQRAALPLGVRAVRRAPTWALFGFRVKKFTCKRLHVFGKKISSQSQQLHTPTAVGPTNGPSPGPNFPHCYNQTRAIVSTEFFPLHQPNRAMACSRSRDGLGAEDLRVREKGSQQRAGREAWPATGLAPTAG